jgi:hypothetical protein
VSENGDPPSGGVKMLAGAGTALVVFAVIGGSTYWAGYWSLGPGTGFQPTGDPPVTISDGSLHVKDAYGWYNLDAHNNAAQLIALTKNGSNTGTIVAGKPCGVSDGKKSPTYLAAAFWATDQNTGEIPPTEITAGSTIIIHHDPKHAPPDSAGHVRDQVIITVPPGPSPGQLMIDTSNAAASDGVFFAEDQTTGSSDNGSHNRRHSRPGNVSSIVVKDSSGKAYITWPASGTLSSQAHFSLGFCFQ